MEKDVARIKNKIFEFRGQKVMLDSDLAELYDVEPKVLNQAVKRNIERFPEDFMFQLTQNEWDSLRSQFVTSNLGHGGRRYAPYVFTHLQICSNNFPFTGLRRNSRNTIIKLLLNRPRRCAVRVNFWLCKLRFKTNLLLIKLL